MSRNIKPKSGRGNRRYLFHDHLTPRIKVYLVYYYNTENVVLMTDGPYTDEPQAYNKMRECLVKGYCAWMVAYNDD